MIAFRLHGIVWCDCFAVFDVLRCCFDFEFNMFIGCIYSFKNSLKKSK